MTGGENDLNTTELYPSIRGCSPPAFPSVRSLHSTFTTTGPSPKIITCGGTAPTKYTATCLMLDLEKQRWEQNIIGNLTKPRAYPAAVSLENIGTYLIGGMPSSKGSTDFLAEGSTEWTTGPEIPVDMSQPCVVKISNQSFIVLYKTDILEYEVDIRDPTSSNGWQSSSKWPNLQTSRERQPGCSKIENLVVIAGGYRRSQKSGESLVSTEVLDLLTKRIEYAGDLNTPRVWFHMTTLIRGGQQLILAFGGSAVSSSLNSVEQFNSNNNTWSLAPTSMAEARHAFGAVAVLPTMMSCPPTREG